MAHDVAAMHVPLPPLLPGDTGRPSHLVMPRSLKLRRPTVAFPFLLSAHESPMHHAGRELLAGQTSHFRGYAIAEIFRLGTEYDLSVKMSLWTALVAQSSAVSFLQRPAAVSLPVKPEQD